MLLMSGLTGLGLFLSRFFPGTTRRGETNLADLLATQTLALVVLAIVIFAIFKTHSRGALLALAAALWLTCWLAAGLLGARNRRLAARVILLGAGACAAGLAWHFANLLTGGRGFHDQSTAQRISLYSMGWRIFRDYPLFGVGMGALAAASGAYKDLSLTPMVVDHIHNDWLEFLLQFGLGSFLWSAAALTALLRRLLKSWGTLDSAGDKCLFGGVLAAALSFIAHGFVEFSFQIPANAVIFLLLLCWLSAAEGQQRRRPALEEGARPRPWRFLASAVALGLIGLSAMPTVSYLFAWEAELEAPAEKPALLERAYWWHADPYYLNQSAVAYFNLAAADPSRSDPLLRKALEKSSASLRADPLNPFYRQWQQAILWRLGRIDDAKRLLRDEPSRPA